MKRNLLVGLLLALLVALVGYPGVRGAFFLDDIVVIVENQDIKDINHLWDRLIYPFENPDVPSRARNDPSRPLVFLTYGLEYHLFGLDPVAWHLFDFALHIATTFFLFLFVRLLYLRLFSITSVVPAAIAGVYFAVHPIAMMTANYPYARSDLMFSLFTALACYLFLQLREKPWARAIALVSCYIVGLAAKQSMFVLPAVILALDWATEGRENWRALWQRKWLYVALISISCLYLVAQFLYFGRIGDTADEKDSLWQPMEYLLAQPYVVLRYLQMFIFPYGMCLDHGIYQAMLRPDTMVTIGQKVFSYAAWLFILIGLVALWRRKTPLSTLLLFGFAFFAILVAPTSSFLPTADAMVDRRAYLAGFGVVMNVVIFFEILRGDVDYPLPNFFNAIHRAAIALANAFMRLIRPRAQPLSVPPRILIGKRTKLQRWGWTVALVAIILAGATYSRHWAETTRTEEGMWREVLESYPKNNQALYNLARIIGDDPAREAEAKAVYERLFTFYPGHFAGYRNNAVIYARKGDFENAEKLLRHALSLRPQHESTRSMLGQVLEMKSYYKRFADALQQSPNNVDVHKNFVRFLVLVNRIPEAKERAEEMKRLFPADEEAQAIAREVLVRP
jgi:tetratricopeptide (TPR) repeat protein